MHVRTQLPKYQCNESAAGKLHCVRVGANTNNYSVEELSDESKMEEVIVKSSWEEVGSGLVGTFALALDAYDRDVDDVEETEGLSDG